MFGQEQEQKSTAFATAIEIYKSHTPSQRKSPCIYKVLIIYTDSLQKQQFMGVANIYRTITRYHFNICLYELTHLTLTKTL